MSDSLGIDVGATTCAAAVSRGAALVPCELGEGGATMAAVALPRRDGTVLVGREADRLSTHEPGVVGRMVTDGLLDPEPVVVDGVPCHPLPLTEALISEVIARAGRAGASPEHVIVAFPLRGGGAPERLLAEAAHRATGGTAVLVPAPIAAAAKLAHDRDLGPAALVAVLDFGGTSVDVTLVRATPEVFDLVGEPISLTDLGGVDVDDAVVTLTESAIGDVRSTVAPDDRVAMLALRRLRASCRTAKERLATEDAAIVDVALSHARAQVEITQAALANAVAPMLDDAVDALMAVIDEAGLIPPISPRCCWSAGRPGCQGSSSWSSSARGDRWWSRTSRSSPWRWAPRCSGSSRTGCPPSRTCPPPRRGAECRPRWPSPTRPTRRC